MWVVKLGGSLQRSGYLGEWVNLLARYGRGKVILVPGGGIFAEKVREMQAIHGFSDKAAHKMALLAMEQYAYLLSGMNRNLQPVSTRDKIIHCLQGNGLPIWLPSEMVLAAGNIPATWAVTSDSLALWLAGELKVKYLLLVKSTGLTEGNASIETLSAQGLVDEFFPQLARRIKIPTFWLRDDEYSRMQYGLTHNDLPAASALET